MLSRFFNKMASRLIRQELVFKLWCCIRGMGQDRRRECLKQTYSGLMRGPLEFWELCLFGRYDLELEYEHRRSRALGRCAASSLDWYPKTREDVLGRVLDEACIRRLVLHDHEAVLTKLDVSCTDEQGWPITTFVQSIPFTGDDLWGHYVEALDHCPQGEVRDGELIIFAFARHDAEARESLAEQRSWIGEIIQTQEERISRLNNRLHNDICDALRDLTPARVLQ